MTNSLPNNSQPLRTVSPEAFARFLECLAADSDEAGRIYARLHEKLGHLLALKGISDPDSAADETLERVIIKIENGAAISDLNHYCMGIARNVARERMRHMRRETSAFLQYLENITGGSDEQAESIFNVMQPCFEELAVEDQKLLEAYCQVMKGQARAEHRRCLAEQMGTTLLALRMRVTRLRRTLTDCVHERLKQI